MCALRVAKRFIGEGGGSSFAPPGGASAGQVRGPSFASSYAPPSREASEGHSKALEDKKATEG